MVNTNTLTQLKRKRDLLNCQIAEIEKRAALKKTEPQRNELKTLEDAFTSNGAWPLLVIVDWSQGNTWLHAHEYYMNFDLCEIYVRRSESGWNGAAGHFSLQGVYGEYKQWHDNCNRAYDYANYFEHRPGGWTLPDSKKYIKDFTPDQMLGQGDLWGGITGRCVFASQAIACPLCGRTSHKIKESEELQNETWRPHVSSNTWQEVEADKINLIRMRTAADLFLAGKFYENGLVFKRCEKCAKKGFRDHWRDLHKKFSGELEKANEERKEKCGNYKPWEAPQTALKHINRIWPDLKIRERLQTSIFRQAKKRARIKPLGRGELAFFSMHLAATQMKELKALLKHNDTDKNTEQAD